MSPVKLQKLLALFLAIICVGVILKADKRQTLVESYQEDPSHICLRQRPSQRVNPGKKKVENGSFGLRSLEFQSPRKRI